MERRIHLPFYGDIDHPRSEDFRWDLYQTAQCDRLRDVSLSSIPSRCSPYGQAANRFQHSVGVAELARRLCENEPSIRPHRDELVAAALLHDSGSPPFSHVSELFLHDRTGMTHERMTLDLLRSSEAASVLADYEIDADAVGRLINGEPHPAGPILAGSIDLDNLDNSLTLWRSLGQEHLLYHPLDLVDAFAYRDGELVVRSESIGGLVGWMETRQRLYRVLHDEPSLSAASMLYRAIEYAVADDSLPEGFFGWDESSAFAYLRGEAPPESRTLVEALARWHHYVAVHGVVSVEPDPRLAGINDDWRARKRLADLLADELGIPDSSLVLYIGSDRGAKAISLPFVGERAEVCRTLFSHSDVRQRIAVFVDSSVVSERIRERVPAVLAECASALPERPAGHVFF